MTNVTENKTAQMMAAQQASGVTKSGALQKGIGGGQGQGLDFISLIMARLQTNGISSPSPTEPSTLEALKGQLQALLAGQGQLQAPAEGAGNAELFQNGTASPLSKEDLLGQLQQLMQGQKPDQAGLFNNSLLAQQLGLNPQNAGDAEIISALQDTFAEMGIDLNAQLNTGELPQQNIEPAAPAQDISAHLNTLTSPQDTAAQNASPAQPQAASSSSPMDTRTLAASPPLADQTDAAGAVTGEDLLLNQTLNASVTGIAQSFVSADAAAQTAARSAHAPAGQAAAAAQKTMKPQTQPNNTTPQMNTAPGQQGNGVSDALNQMTQAQNALSSAMGASNQNGGASAGSDFMSGQDFMNGFNQQNQGNLDFDGQLAQQLRADTVQTQAKNAAASGYTNANYRPGTPPQQVVRAITLNMTRGANNAIDRMSMQLEPAELGRVQVDLKMADDGTLKAHILTDKAETLQILQKDSSALQKAMADAGLDVGSESFSFDLRDQNDGQLAQDKNNREALFDLTGIDGAEDMEMAPADLMAAQYGQQYIRPSGVNVYV